MIAKVASLLPYSLRGNRVGVGLKRSMQVSIGRRILKPPAPVGVNSARFASYGLKRVAKPNLDAPIAPLTREAGGLGVGVSTKRLAFDRAVLPAGPAVNFVVGVAVASL